MTKITEIAWFSRIWKCSMFRIFSFLTKILKTSELIDIHTTPALSVSNPWKPGKLRVKTFDAIEFQTPEVIKKTPVCYTNYMDEEEMREYRHKNKFILSKYDIT